MRIELELKTSESIFDPDKVLVKVKELEFLSEQSDFWSNQKKAQGTLKELSLLKKSYPQLMFYPRKTMIY